LPPPLSNATFQDRTAGPWVGAPSSFPGWERRRRRWGAGGGSAGVRSSKGLAAWGEGGCEAASALLLRTQPRRRPFVASLPQGRLRRRGGAAPRGGSVRPRMPCPEQNERASYRVGSRSASRAKRRRARSRIRRLIGFWSVAASHGSRSGVGEACKSKTRVPLAEVSRGADVARAHGRSPYPRAMQRP